MQSYFSRHVLSGKFSGATVALGFQSLDRALGFVAPTHVPLKLCGLFRRENAWSLSRSPKRFDVAIEFHYQVLCIVQTLQFDRA